LIQNSSDTFSRVVIIPVYRNTKQLLKTLDKFSKIDVSEVCVVIDQADKNDLQQIENVASKNSIPISVITNSERKGIGFAIRAGIEYALKRNYHIAVVMAGNGKDQPNDISRLLSPILMEQYQYVQGSRFLKGGNHQKNPFLRGVFSRLFPLIWSIFTKSRCTDVTNGFRAYDLKIFRDKRINIWQDWLNGYQLEYYIHYKVLTLGFKVKEVPVSKIYPFRHKGGYSNIQPFKDWWQIVGPLIYLRMGIRE
jgi:dolichol-phosphate mannosyltransferase